MDDLMELPASKQTRRAPVPVLVLCGVMATLILVFNLSYPGHYHFSLLAHSFVEGKAHLTESLYTTSAGDFATHDLALYRGQYFWPLGPLPAVLLIPFALVPWNMLAPTPEGILNLLLVGGIIVVLIKIFSRWFKSSRDRVILALAFIAGSPLLYVALIPKSWFVAQNLTVLLLLLALHEYLNKRRYGFIGLLFGLILATRVTAVIGISFFVYSLVNNFRAVPRELIRNLIMLVIPTTLVGIFLGAYNFARFNSPFEQGYRHQLVADQLVERKSLGFFSVNHIPSNLFYLLLAPPNLVTNRFHPEESAFPYMKADPWGMSILITSPYLVYLFLVKPFRELSREFLVVSGVVMIPILFYYGIGFYQFGYRYILDAFPFLFLAFVIEYRNRSKNVSTPMAALIVGSAVLNLFFVSTLFCTRMLCEL